MYVLSNRLPVNYKDLYNKLLSEYKDYLYGIGVNLKRNIKSYEDSVKCFLYNESRATKSLMISLDQKVYNKPSIVNGKASKLKISYIFTKRLIDFLEQECYLKKEVGGYESTHYIFNPEYTEGGREDKWKKEHKFKSSRVVFYDKWRKLKEDLVTEDVVTPEINVLYFKNKDKQVVNRTLDYYLKDKRDFLQEVNKFNAEYYVDVDGVRYSLQSYKVYNDSKKTVGGKTYTFCGYQNLPKVEREKTMINGVETICLDFKCFEASVLYTLEQELIPETDLYYVGIEDFDPKVERSLMKTVFIIMMNTSSRLSATSAVNRYLKEEFPCEKFYKAGMTPTKFLSAKKLIDYVLDKHYKIKNRFFKGKCSKNNIQHITSEVNDYIVSSLMDKDIVTAQVHDGFVVQHQHEQILRETMSKGYEIVLGDNSNCRISKEF